jgi:hypothetical protein
MRSATASLCQSFLVACRRVFGDEVEEDHLDDQRDHRGQDASTCGSPEKLSVDTAGPRVANCGRRSAQAAAALCVMASAVMLESW